MSTHRDLIVWQEAMKLVAAVYRETATYPREERYGLVMQTRKSAVSIPSNIAEGSGRNTTGELVYFLGVASGSLAELETEIELGSMLAFLPDADAVMKQLRRVGRLLIALRNSVKRDV